MFPTQSIPSTLLPTEYDRLTKLLAAHFAFPLPYPLAGAFFEELFASAVGGVREPRKLLFDVLRDSTGWSLKTLQWAKRGSGDSFELVLQRCDILRDPGLSLDSPVEVLGERIHARFHRFCMESYDRQHIDDPRAGFLVRDRAQTEFVFFQQRYRLYTAPELRWRWATPERNSLMGYAEDRLAFRWYRSGTQLFGVYTIPDHAHRFRLEWRRAGLDETMAFLANQGVVRLAVDS